MNEAKTRLINDEMSEKIVRVAGKIALAEGVSALNVRRILGELNISNRVFYNRFKNIGEVLELLYESTVTELREGWTLAIASEGDFFEKVIEMVGKALSISYDAQMKFNYYLYENDSLINANYVWWTAEIKRLIEYGKEQGYLKNVDSEKLAYSVWCFCRGYNADAVARKLPKDEAISNFKYSFSFLLEGLKS